MRVPFNHVLIYFEYGIFFLLILTVIIYLGILILFIFTNKYVIRQLIIKFSNLSMIILTFNMQTSLLFYHSS